MDMLTVTGKLTENGSDQDSSLIDAQHPQIHRHSFGVVCHQHQTLSVRFLIFFNPGLVCNQPIINQHICVEHAVSELFLFF